MKTHFYIEDEWHAEVHGDFATRELALVELRRRAAIPWDVEPNLAPCTGWRSCGRRYELVEVLAQPDGEKEQSRTAMLEITAQGAKWLSP